MKKSVQILWSLLFCVLFLYNAAYGQDVIVAKNGKQTVESCSASFSDSGGNASNYADNETDTIVFYPSVAGGKVSVTFTSFATEADVDILSIYNGPVVAAKYLINDYSGTFSPGTVTSKSADGALAVVFYSDGDANDAGWQATVSCVTPDVPSCATGLSPANGATGVAASTSLSWTAVSGASSYTVYVSTNADLSGATTYTQSGTTQSVSLTTNTKYYWKVVPVNDAGQATGCSTVSFTTVKPVQNVTVVYPNGGEVFTIGDTLHIEIEKTTNSYLYLYLSADSAFSSYTTVLNGTYYDIGTYTFDYVIPASFKVSKKCVVYAYEGSGGSDYSDRGFTIKGLPPSLSVTFPKAGSVLTPSAGTYIYYTSVNYTGYANIYYSTDNGVSWNVAVSNIYLYENNSSSTYWTVPAMTGDFPNSKIKIVSQDESLEYTTSRFTISSTQPTFAFVEPGAGDVVYRAQYNSFVIDNLGGNTSYQYLYYSLDGGSTYTYYSYFYPSAGVNTLSWYTPSIDSIARHCRLRWGNAAPYLYSEEFVIAPKPTLTIQKPNYEYLSWGASFPINFTAQNVANVKVEYSTDNGSTWSSIVNKLAVTEGANALIWNVPSGSGYKYAYLRISDASNADITTTNYFYINDKYFDLTSPNGGETYTAGDTISVAFTTTVAGYVYIYLSNDNGATFTQMSLAYYNIGNNVASVVIPSGFDGGSNCLIKLSGYSYNGSDISENTFTINPLPASLAVTFPGSGAVLSPNTYTYIQYNTINYTGYTNMYYSTDNGDTWTSISSPYVYEGQASSVYWYVPNLTGTYTNCKVKFATQDGAVVFITDNFTISSTLPTFAFTAPAEGEVLYRGTYNYAKINNLGGTTTYQYLYYSLDGGNTWTYYSYYYPTTGINSIQWYVPSIDTVAHHCMLRWGNDPYVYSNTFVIAPEPTISISKPNYEYMSWGGVFAVNFTIQNIQNVKLEYSVDNGTTYNVINSSLAVTSGANTYMWNVPSGTDYKYGYLRISDASNASVSATAYFYVNQKYFDLLSPNGGETYTAGDTLAVQFSNTQYDYMYFNLSNDGGKTFTQVGAGYYAAGTHIVNIPVSLTYNGGKNCLLKVSGYYYSGSDVSANFFTINPQPAALYISAPSEGEILNPGSNTTISFGSVNYTGSCRLFYSINDGASWTLIYNSSYVYEDGTSSYSWTVPSVFGNYPNSYIKIESAEGDVVGISDKITISNTQPSLLVTAPVAGDNFEAGKSITLSVTNRSSSTFYPYVYITYDGGTNWTYLGYWGYLYKGDASKAFSIPVETKASKNCYIGLSDYYRTVVYALSDSFVVKAAPPQINQFYTPAANAYLKSGATSQLSWYNYGIDTVVAQLSIDGGESWQLIANIVVSGGYNNYNWQVPAIVSGNSNSCVVRLSDKANTSSVFATSPTFSISDKNQLEIVSPTKGDVVNAGDQLTIRYKNNGRSLSYQYMYVFYSTDSSSWTYVSYFYGLNTGENTYSITIPKGMASDKSVYVNVCDNYSGPYYATLKAASKTFEVVGLPATIEVTKPIAGDYLTTYTSRYITWTSLHVSTVKLEYTVDGGANWTYITNANSYDDYNNSYTWSVPAVSGTKNNSAVRVTNASDATVGDTSDVFTMSGLSQLQIARPSTSDVLQAGKSFAIAVQNNGKLVNYAYLYYTLNDGGWTSLGTMYTLNSGLNQYNWNVPEGLVGSAKYRIVVYDYDHGTYDTTEYFTVKAANPSVTVTSPTVLTSYWSGTGINISYNHTGIANVDIDYKLGKDSAWINIATNVNASGYQYWTIPVIKGSDADCYVRVKSADDASIVSISDPFTIRNEPTSYAMTKPDGGTVYTAGENVDISFNNSGKASYATLYYSLNSGSWNYITQMYTNTGSNAAEWYIPATTDKSKARIKVVDYYNNAIVDSSALFTIKAATPYVYVYTPSYGAYWVSGKTYQVQINTLNVDDAVVELSTDGGTTYATIDTFKVTDGYNYLSVTAPAIDQESTYAMIRVRKLSKSTIYGTSNVFTLSPKAPAILVVSPNGGETFTAGQDIKVVANNKGSYTYANVAYSLDSGTTWTTAYSERYFYTGSNTLSIFIPYYTKTTTNALVRIVPADADHSSDVSDAVFTIKAVDPFITVSSPSSGTNWWSGEEKGIYWTSAHVSKVNIYYSTDNQQSWNTIASGVECENGENSYSWTAPVVNGKKDSSFIKVINAENDALADASERFTINNSPSTLTITKPNGGESYTAGNNISIQYKYNGRSGRYADIYLSTDNGAKWKLVVDNASLYAGNNTSYYQIPYDSKTYKNCKVAIEETGVEQPAKDTSNGVFVIKTIPASITVTSPNSGSYIIGGEMVTVNWTSNKVTKANVDYSLDGGTTWTSVVTGYATNDGSNNYSFLAPAVDAMYSNSLVRVSSATQTTVTDNSETFIFSNVPIALTIVSPNGGNMYKAGKSYSISFTKTGPLKSTYVYAYASINGGDSYNYVGSAWYAGSGTGTITWNVDKTASGKYCKVKLTDSYDELVDYSDDWFEIQAADPAIEVSSPYQYANWVLGNYAQIAWNSVSVSTVKLQYSTNAGDTWKTIVSGIATPNGYNTYSVEVPSVSQNEYNSKVRVVAEEDTTVLGVSEIFTISPKPATLALTSPNGGEVLKTGSTYYVELNYTGIPTDVTIAVTPNNGYTWRYLGTISVTEGKNSLQWTVADDMTPSAYYKVRAITADGDVFDLSDGYISIVSGTPVIDLTTPSGSAYLVANQNTSISWTAKNVESVKIEYTVDEGTTWMLVTDYVYCTQGYNSYSWSVPYIADSLVNAQLRITDNANSKVYDRSESFIIGAEQRALTITYPNGGDTLYASKYYNIAFNNTGPATNVNVYFFTGDSYTWLATVKASNGKNKAEIYIPAYASTNNIYSIGINDAYDDDISDKSDNDFTVIGVDPVVTLKKPMKTDKWSVGDKQTISWESYNIDSLNLFYTINGGTKWDTIAYKVAATNGLNNFEWTIPDVKAASKDAKIKAVSATNAKLKAESEVFTLLGTPVSLTMVAPNGGEVVKAGSADTIRFNYTGNGSYVTIDVSSDSGSVYNQIQHVWASYGSNVVVTQIPYDATLSDKYFMKVTDENGLSDVSNAAFSVVTADPTIVLSNPTSGDYWVSKSVQTITWFGWNVTKVNIQYSLDSGATWKDVRKRVPSWDGDNTYNWTIPEVIGDKKAVVRITSASDAKLVSTSNVFIVTDAAIAFTFTSPTENDSLRIGEAKAVGFYYRGPSTWADISLSVDSGATWSVISQNVAATMGNISTNVTVPYGTQALAKALLRVEDTENAAVYDLSDSFVLAPAKPVMWLEEPIANAYWVSGTIQSIFWTSYSVAKVKLEYSLDGGTTWKVIKASVSAKEGENKYNWKVAAVASAFKNSKIRITSLASGSLVTTSAAITISDKYPSNNARLTQIAVNAVALSGFDMYDTDYDYSNIRKNSTYVPVVTAKADDVNAHISVTRAASPESVSTIMVTAEDGISVNYYYVHFSRMNASSDASLKDLKMTGTTITGFTADVMKYKVELPAGTTKAPVLTATAKDSMAGFIINSPASLPGKAMVVVTAEDGVTKKVYEIAYSIAISVNTIVADNIKLYPNPVHDKFYIANAANANVFIYNFNGQLVKTINNIDANASISLDGAHTGMYVVKIVNGSSVAIKKIEVVK